MSIKLIITFKVKKEKLDTFLEIIKEVKVALPKVAGCLGVQAFQADENPYIFTLVESWESVQKHQSHIKQVIDSGDWEQIASHLEEDPISDYFHEI